MAQPRKTIRGLLAGTETGWSGPLAIGWCLLIAVGSYFWRIAILATFAFIRKNRPLRHGSN